MILVSISRNSLILALFALVTAAVLALTFRLTQSHIAAAERRAAQKALLEIVPEWRHDNDLLTDTRTLSAGDATLLGVDNSHTIHLAKKDARVVAAIIPTLTNKGYSGDIKLIVGVNADGSVAGVRVLTHKETPGLGDKIDLKKSEWILSFDGLSLDKPSAQEWTVKKDGGYFDQFTGATITPRAVVEQVALVLEYVRKHHDMIFAEAES